MNLCEREMFWRTLCSLPGKDLPSEQEQLCKTIKYPKFLYRYRSVTMKNLEALRTNKLYFSSANYYDDPFDTFLHIDIKKIKNDFFRPDATRLTSIVDRIKANLPPEKVAAITVESVQQLLSSEKIANFISSILLLRDEIKKDTWSVCFSENGFNETLWLKYADQHKGFALIYDVENSDNYLCGKYEKCVNCGIKQFATPIYPVNYSDEPYDATNFVMQIIMRKLEENSNLPLRQMLSFSTGTGLWEQERTTLIKKKCHEYDEEWRMILACNMKPPIMMEWIPSGIILGLRMEASEEHLVVSMAKEAGVKDIYKSYINAQNKLDAYPLRNS